MKKRILQVDFNTWYFICNMQCQYCIKHYDYRIENNNLYLRKTKYENYKFYARIEHLFLRAYQVLKKLNEQYDVGILTFSGSETFLFEYIFDLLEKIDGMFPVIQLITNGLSLDKTSANKLKKFNNVHITLSLDGNSVESNYSRTKNDKDKLDNILRNLDYLIEEGIIFDIYTVITKYNIDHLENFFRFLEYRKSGAGIQIWPVFGNGNLMPSKEQIKSLEKLSELHQDFNLKLQPKKYYQYLINYFKNFNREIPCYLPYCSFFLRDNGDIKACLCNGIIDIGNILKDSPIEIAERQQEEIFYKNILYSYRKMLPCSKCFINWDIINLYFCDEITIEDIRNIPLFSNEKIVLMIKQLKEQVVKNYRRNDIKNEVLC
ncbi:radical SAM protein [Acetivibrio clariflavus]|uniref:radical SAM protein n=1 Tax=Acetivibrio clariflavus TaxID=288965 RepID=UPI0031F5A6B9